MAACNFVTLSFPFLWWLKLSRNVRVFQGKLPSSTAIGEEILGGYRGYRGNFVAKIFSSSSTILHRHHAIVDIDDDQRIYDFAHFRDVESDLRQLRAFAHVRAPYLFAKISSSIAIADPDLQRCDRLVRQTGSTLQGPTHTFHSLGDPP
ncbi:hypothetical protein V1507DRAFT_437932 [Lipomyces tetrasporus]